MKKILAEILIFVVIAGALLFLSPYSEKILGTENFADDILALFNGATNGLGGNSNHTCVFDKQDASDKFRATAATCTDPSQYYYSCSCGEKGPDKFNHGEPKGHVNELLIEGDYNTSYLVGETFDATGMIAILYCSNCENTEEVEDITVPYTAPFTDSLTPQTITVTAGDLSATITYRAMKYAMTDVELIADEATGNVYYVVSGRYLEGFNVSDIFFSFTDADKFYWMNDKSSELLSIEVNEAERTFKMSLDVTDFSVGVEYTPYYFGKDWNKANGNNKLTDYTGKHDGDTVTVGNMTYTLMHKNNSEDANFGVPVLYKTLELNDIEYKGTGVKLELDETAGKVYYVVTGTSKGYTNGAELKADIQMTFSQPHVRFLSHDHMEAFEFDAETGNYTFKIDVSVLPDKPNPYFTRFGEGLKDFNGVPKKNVDTTTVNYNGKIYAIVYGANTQAEGYGTVSIKVSVDDSTKFTATSVNLELDEANGKVYYVVSGTSEGYESLEKFAAGVNFSVGNATEDNLTVTAFDAATGAFTFKVDVTDLAISSAIYPTKIGRQIESLKYFNDIAIENVDIATKLTLNGKSYQLVYVPGSTDQPNGYGAVSVQVSNATQIATSVSLAVENDRAYYVIDGISLKYATQEELMADFKFRIANIPDGSSNGKTYLTEANVIVASFDATTGSFTLKIDITDLILNSKPYYTRIGNADGVSDFNYLDVSKVEMSDVTADGKTFSLVYVPGSKKGSEGYGTISIKVTNAG